MKTRVPLKIKHNVIILYYDIIKNSKEIYTFREKYSNNGLTDFSKIEVKEFLESYGLKEDVFLIEEDSDLYDFSEILRGLSVE